MTNEKFEPIRIRIMKEAYDLADKGDTDGYNSVKVMCGDVQKLLRRAWVGLTDEEKAYSNTNYLGKSAEAWHGGVEWAEARLKERNK